MCTQTLNWLIHKGRTLSMKFRVWHRTGFVLYEKLYKHALWKTEHTNPSGLGSAHIHTSKDQILFEQFDSSVTQRTSPGHCYISQKISLVSDTTGRKSACFLLLHWEDLILLSLKVEIITKLSDSGRKNITRNRSARIFDGLCARLVAKTKWACVIVVR